MRALALFAVLQAAPALALAQGAPGTAPSSGARPVVQSAGASPAAPPSSVTGVTAAPAPGTTTVTAAPSSPQPSTAAPTATATPTAASPTPAATANPAATATASPAPTATASPVVTASPAQTPPASPAATPTAASVPVAPTAAVAERLAQGDRAFGAGDVRGALFAYQDAVYLQPGYVFARVKLGRAYLALRYPAQAIAQGELALASDPTSDDARRLLEEARAARVPAPALSASPTPQPAAAAPAAPAAAAAPAIGAPTAAIPAGATVVVVMPAGVAPGTTIAVPSAAPAAPAAAPAPAGTQPRTYRLTPEPYDAPAPLPAAPAQAGGPTAAQRYRSALDLVARREYGAAIALLDDAIALDPRLAVAYTARASAKFGQRRFREAADDYKAALGLDPALGTPLYGLAECYRLLGDPLAGELYRRYSNSHARDVREELRSVARARADELSGR
ncbi:tetratricopeptide repeat protein [Anaeromyxobacter soli]|uniref:tetratricopeptide repeat protein n=1 Tax=Anaeromyxobacter soli TaxID=2922725 RepID=UPI001FAF1DA4|nr:tetratricopeptide repeat protein [Anaeromyxobacter sp. SG29]